MNSITENMMKILIAADGSKYTQKAVRHVARNLNWFQGEPELHLIHVMTPIPPGRGRAFLGDDAINNYYKEESEAALEPAEKLLRKQELAYHACYKIGNVAEEIQSYVKKHKIDMIVVGSHGHSAFENLVMGSVATKIIAATTAPVLIVR
jgi:nucleotide-binding universal stress UspA family protein